MTESQLGGYTQRLASLEEVTQVNSNTVFFMECKFSSVLLSFYGTRQFGDKFAATEQSWPQTWRERVNPEHTPVNSPETQMSP